MAHRINTLEELRILPKEYGVELDLRDNIDGSIYIQHNPFEPGEDFEEYLKEVGTLKNRIIRYAKANIGKGGALNKLEVLLQTYVFCNVGQAAKEINWSKQPLIEL